MTQQSTLVTQNRADKDTKLDTGASEAFVDDRTDPTNDTPTTEQGTLMDISGSDDTDESDSEPLRSESEFEGHLHKWGMSGLRPPTYESGAIRITACGNRRKEFAEIVIIDTETGEEYTAAKRINWDLVDSVLETLADCVAPDMVDFDPETNGRFKAAVSEGMARVNDERSDDGLGAFN